MVQDVERIGSSILMSSTSYKNTDKYLFQGAHLFSTLTCDTTAPVSYTGFVKGCLHSTIYCFPVVLFLWSCFCKMLIVLKSSKK